MSASSCGDFRGPKSVAPVDDLTSSSSLNPPVTTIYLSTGACEHNALDKKCVRSALLSAKSTSSLVEVIIIIIIIYVYFRHIK